MNQIDDVIKQYTAEAIKLTGDLPGGAFPQDSPSTMIHGGGSDRFFLRITDGRRSIVAIIQPGRASELSRYISIGDFLRKNQVPVPEFYSFDSEQGILMMEDLGSIHLEDALKYCTVEVELSYYRECIDILYMFQTSVNKDMMARGILEDNVFSEEKLLGETKYFEREFIGRFCSSIPDGWETERLSLAKQLSAEPLVFMHRDLQCRNVMVKNGEIRLIDFQDAHRGPGIYDAASILKGLYHPIRPGTRKTLLMELYYRLKEVDAITEETFEEYLEKFTLAAIQRNLQALAAFAFLGFEKKKESFLESIPRGIDTLEDSIAESGKFPAVESIVRQYRENHQE
ncbi:MAG: phosphotransferase [Candidatus Krumholzibacteriota bacterium]|nr:phosphotransferase [Candidatus Krumholzibacteriota bacterium]